MTAHDLQYSEDDDTLRARRNIARALCVELGKPADLDETDPRALQELATEVLCVTSSTRRAIALALAYRNSFPRQVVNFRGVLAKVPPELLRASTNREQGEYLALLGTLARDEGGRRDRRPQIEAALSSGGLQPKEIASLTDDKLAGGAARVDQRIRRFRQALDLRIPTKALPEKPK